MKRLVTFILVLMVMAVLAAPVAANNGNGSGRGNGDGGGTVWNKKKCEDAGGYWYNERGVKSCNTIQAGDVEFPDTAWDDQDWEAIMDFLQRDPDDRTENTINVFVVLTIGTSQRGNVGAFGTRGTEEPKITCETLGNVFLPDSVCEWIASLGLPH